MKEKLKKERGITLIALIVTIIMLLILSAVSIATLTGDRGLLKKASEAREAAREAEAVEAVKLALISARAEYTLNNNMDLEKYIKEENEKIEVSVDLSTNNDKNPERRMGI